MISKVSVFISGALLLAERGYLPDALLRSGIRRLCRNRLAEIEFEDKSAGEKRIASFVDAMNHADIAPIPHKANQQHYELPAQFFELILGIHRKYSCGYWDDSEQSLDQSEQRALERTCEYADIRNGDQILELGCGWGSLTLWMAQQFPASHITAISNSASQRAHIVRLAADRGLRNLDVLTRDINHFDTESKFDRIVSVEMFEHLRNYGEIFGRISNWLNEEGQFFMHIFCHRNQPYEFIDRGPGDWMTRYFFAGGMMPSVDLPLRFQHHLALDQEWHWSGTHYQHTANTWLRNLDQKKLEIIPILAAVYGHDSSQRWFHRWRLFFIACAELFGMQNGTYWGVHHYRFRQAKCL